MATFMDSFVGSMTDYDSYEWRARIAVGGIVAIPSVVGIAFFSQGRTLPQLLLSAAVLEVLLAALLAQIVRSLGHQWVRYRKKAIPDVIVINSLADCDAPEGEHIPASDAQVAEWRAHVRRRVGLDLDATGDCEERKLMAGDAYSRLLYQLRDPNSGATKFLQKHTIEYGFSRNLAGSWSLWLVTSLVFAVGLMWYAIGHPAAAFGAWTEFGFLALGFGTITAIEAAVPDAAMHLATVFLCALVDCKPVAKPATATAQSAATVGTH